jgi:hypothetical protein
MPYVKICVNLPLEIIKEIGAKNGGCDIQGKFDG